MPRRRRRKPPARGGFRAQKPLGEQNETLFPTPPNVYAGRTAFRNVSFCSPRLSHFARSPTVQIPFVNGFTAFTIFHLPSRLSKRTRAFSPPRARFLRPPIARRSSLLPIASWQVRLLAQARPAEHVDSGAGPCGRLRRRFATCPTKQSFFGAFAASRRSGCSPLTETRRWPRRA